MNISIITVFPELYDSFLSTSLLVRAQEQGLISFNVVAFSAVCKPKERIDEPTCGPGAGMVLKPEVVADSIAHCEKRFGPGYKIFFSPQGTSLTQTVLQGMAKKLYLNSPEGASALNTKSECDHIILVCPRYEGVDDRVQAHYADMVISIGDYVLMGGDLPAQVFLEGFLRLIPGVVGNQESVQEDSFSGSLLDYPTYGLPKIWHDQKIPDIVFSGNHARIEQWRDEQALKKTLTTRFDWFRRQVQDEHEFSAAMQQIPLHYVALMHTDVYVKGERLGTTSIKSIDMHDISRTCATYGIKRLLPITPLTDQRTILKKFLDFWLSEEGARYNSARAHAVKRIQPFHSLSEAIETIRQKTGKAPLLVATSAKEMSPVLEKKVIDYSQQSKVWSKDRPVLLLFGTGYGLSADILDQVDYILVPVRGMPTYNHLSVRSAVAIVLDRWLGIFTKNRFSA